MSAQIYILPVVARIAPHDRDWREQYDRTCLALCEALREPPPRTRPILITRQLSAGHRPEGE